ncbi:MAG: AAA family ATPase [Gemmataceae bacterium]|nr:AAA family ATPase [Gemmataceae bacterium]
MWFSRSDPPFLCRLRQHFRADPTYLPAISESFEKYEHANLHLAIQDYASQDKRSAQLLGMLNQGYLGAEISVSDLLRPAGSRWSGIMPPQEGPVEYASVALEGEEVMSCVARGLFLIQGPEGELAVLLQMAREMSHDGKIKIEVMANRQDVAESFLCMLRKALRQRSVYRGRVLTLHQETWPPTLNIRFHPLPQIQRDNIILPEGLLDRVERLVHRFGQHRDKLLAAGRHLKRGILLHGPPGTGKTLTAMYLAGQSSGRTVLLLSGFGLGLIPKTCAMARTLQPAMVVLEDVDLIAEQRTNLGAACTNPILFELLNEMDGLSEDADIIFLLTTNRPDLLEPALASRPGRIDQAIEVPLPDTYGRKRLFQLYGQGLNLRLDNLDSFIKRTKGASGAFIRELMRKAALFAADDGPELVVEERHMEDALHELVVHGKELTKSLLGFRTGPEPTN